MQESTDNAARPLEELTFREGMDELGRIVAALESNSLELEESLRQYEQGVALVRELSRRLDDAQQRVDVLMGELEAAPSDEEIDSNLSKA